MLVGMMMTIAFAYHARNAPFHPSIHHMGNVGPLGHAHAQGAWIATRLIDQIAYGGRNVRAELARRLARDNPSAAIVDVGCGAGTLTHELVQTGGFSRVVGVDTSPEMLHQARLSVKGADFTVGNGIDLHRLPLGKVDVAVASFVAHEMPRSAHRRLLRSMNRAAPSGDVVVVDIAPTYQPSTPMLAGEPFVEAYIETIEETIAQEAERLHRVVKHEVLVPEHVEMWVLTPAAS